MQAKMTAIGVANPPYKRTQQDTAELISTAFYLKPSQQKILKSIYKSSGIETRHSVISDYCKSPGEFEFFPNSPKESFPTTAKRMQLYKDSALTLALSAIEDCLGRLDTFHSSQITHLITVSCTGMYAPGIDIEIVQKLNLSPATKRTTINFMGCYGAFNGLKVAQAFCQADQNANVLLVCVELCSIHFQNNFSIENIVSNAIFADGAAAVLVQGSPEVQNGLCMDTFYCDLIPQTSQEMAWHIADYGFDIVLSAYVPNVIKYGIATFREKLLQQANYTLDEIDYYAIHPGGQKILQSCEEVLHITPHDNRYSYNVLRDFGNMSSATVLFVLKNIWDSLTLDDHLKTIFSCAFGPGLTLESMLLTVRKPF